MAVVPLKQSLSARRAWIEMLPAANTYASRLVALRKESVDRNFSAGTMVPLSKPSLSARRAWIEMW